MRNSRRFTPRGETDAELPHLDGNFDVGAINLNRVRRQFNGAIPNFFARTDVIFPHVPGTTYYLSLQDAFAQRSALVKARIVGGINLPADIVQADLDAVHGYDECLSRLQI